MDNKAQPVDGAVTDTKVGVGTSSLAVARRRWLKEATLSRAWLKLNLPRVFAKIRVKAEKQHPRAPRRNARKESPRAKFMAPKLKLKLTPKGE